LGCGPVGLAVISLLHARGVRTIVATDLSSGRRGLPPNAAATWSSTLARTSHTPPLGDHHLTTIPAAAELAIATMEKLRRALVAWHHVWRAAEMLCAKPKRL
jgi:hypothetical protein